ncbi:MAG: thiol-disulfide oxidoreductase DCC family protein [Arenicellales bacterium]
MTDKTAMTRPIVFYDGDCPLCRREIAYYQRIDRERRIQWTDIQQEPDTLRAHGLSWEQAMQRMHVQDSNELMVSGAAAFVVLWRHIPRYRILSGVVSLPGIHWLTEQVYTVFARRRYLSRCSNQVCTER